MASPPGDPRNTRAYRQAVAVVLAHDDLCHLCRHHGARTGDHIISVHEWLHTHGTYDGVNHPSNLAPAHGNNNPCPTCRQRCNQVRGARSLAAEPHSRRW